ncbi:MAG: 30S ribosomal protein S20 [Acidobacteria bacterium]|nr:30S ribosomal protein S20 [Acidobacteriota bacterium]
MAHHKAALKSIRQTAVRTERNRYFKSTMRTYIKRLHKLMDEHKVQEAQQLLPTTLAVIDRSVSKGVVHKNTAARYKSRLTMQLNKMAAKAE